MNKEKKKYLDALTILGFEPTVTTDRKLTDRDILKVSQFYHPPTGINIYPIHSTVDSVVEAIFDEGRKSGKCEQLNDIRCKVRDTMKLLGL